MTTEVVLIRMDHEKMGHGGKPAGTTDDVGHLILEDLFEY